jgi:hypothetical protein
MENSVLDWYGHVLRMGNNRWPGRILKLLAEGRKRRGKAQNDVGKGSRAMKQKNLTH